MSNRWWQNRAPVPFRRACNMVSFALYFGGEVCNTCIWNYFQSLGYNRYINKDIEDMCDEDEIILRAVGINHLKLSGHYMYHQL